MPRGSQIRAELKPTASQIAKMKKMAAQQQRQDDGDSSSSFDEGADSSEHEPAPNPTKKKPNVKQEETVADHKWETGESEQCRVRCELAVQIPGTIVRPLSRRTSTSRSS